MKTIKRFQSFLESQDDVKIIIDDMLLEYMDKYNIFSVEEDTDLIPDQRKDKNGFYRISDQITTTYFKVDGFPNDAKGYQVSLHIKNLEDESEFKEDMMIFINRVCKNFGFEYDTYFKEYAGSKNYVIAFYTNLDN